MNNIKNLEAAKELVKKYNSITIKVIEKAFIKEGQISEYAMLSLTGYGNNSTCSLCIAVKRNCDHCIYVKITNTSCINGKNENTYYNIKEAESPTEILEAVKKRAKYLQSLIDQAESL